MQPWRAKENSFKNI